MIVTPFDWKIGYDSFHMDTFFISYQMKLLWMIKRAIAFNRSSKREKRTLFSFLITLKWKHIEVPDKLWIIRCLLMQLSFSSQVKTTTKRLQSEFTVEKLLRNYFFVKILFWKHSQKLPLNLATWLTSLTYAAQCENSIFVELLRWAAHLHSAVTLMLNQHWLGSIIWTITI